MSGICGIWHLDGRPVERPLLSRLSATMAHRGPDGESLWVQGPVGMACQHLQITPESVGETQPLIHPAGPVLVFDGRLDNREELLQDPRVSQTLASAQSSDASIVLAAYQAWGDAFTERLNGDFALALFDPRLQRMILARDVIGIRPIYYCRADKLLLFATEIKALLAHPQVAARPNQDALASYLVGRRLIADLSGTTLFDGIFSIPPAHAAVQTPDDFVVKRYWDFDPHQRVRFQSAADYAAAFRHHFEQAVRRRIRSAAPVAVSVSGGLDSSSIFCMAQTLRQRAASQLPECQAISYTSSDGGVADERPYLDDIENMYGCQIERVPLLAAGFAEGARASMWYTEGPLVDTQATFNQQFHRRARQNGARVLLTGHWGDQVLAGTDHLIDLFHQLAWGKVWAHLNELPRWESDVAASHSHRLAFLRKLLRHHVPHAWVPTLKTIRAALERTSAGPARSLFTEQLCVRARRQTVPDSRAHPRFASRYATALYEEARRPFHVECMEWNNKMEARNGMDVAFPFLDRDLLSFLLAIPGEVAQQGGVARWILREGLAGVLPDSIRERRWKADFTHVGNRGASQDFPRLMKELGPGCRIVSDGYVDANAMRHEIARLMAGDWSESSALSRGLGTLYGLELWLRTFF